MVEGLIQIYVGDVAIRIVQKRRSSSIAEGVFRNNSRRELERIRDEITRKREA